MIRATLVALLASSAVSISMVRKVAVVINEEGPIMGSSSMSTGTNKSATTTTTAATTKKPGASTSTTTTTAKKASTTKKATTTTTTTRTTTTTTTTTRVMGPLGGSGGGAWNDGARTKGIDHISVFSGGAVDAIQVAYLTTGTSWVAGAKHGGNGGGYHKFQIKAGEYVKTVKVRHGGSIDKLEFATNTGRWSGRYGGHGGGETVYNAPPGAMLGSFRGRSGSRVDQLSFVFVPAKVHPR